MDDSEPESRFHRLTSREVRVLVLTVEHGLTPREIAETLGLPRTGVANTLRSIRRKLAVPPYADLGRFVAAREGLAAALAGDQSSQPGAHRRHGRGRGAESAPPEGLERRHKHVLRATLEELEALVARTRTSASALLTLAADVGPDEAASMEREAEVLTAIEQDLEDVLVRSRVRARSTNGEPAPRHGEGALGR